MDMDVLSDDQITERLAGLPGWTRDGDNIVHVAKLADFKAAMLYVGAVAYLAEAANHHPDITIEWNTVTLALSTHSAGGLTAKDFALAGQISQLG
jgi:4a-hydroxytetrahydrobiopterin dehydratase